MSKLLVSVSLDDAFFLSELKALGLLGEDRDCVFQRIDQEIGRILKGFLKEKKVPEKKFIQIDLEDAQKVCDVINRYLVLHPKAPKEIYAAFGRLLLAIHQAKKGKEKA